MTKEERIKELCKEHRMEAPGRNPTGKNDRADTLLQMIEMCINRETVMIEIGAFKGVATEMFALHCKKIYVIDPYHLGDNCRQDGGVKVVEWAYHKMIKRMEVYNNFEHIMLPSNKAYKWFDDNSIDFVYIDGDHREEAVYRDIKNYFPIVKQDGIIAGHDYHGKVKCVIDHVLGEPDKVFGESSWIRYKDRVEKLKEWKHE